MRQHERERLRSGILAGALLSVLLAGLVLAVPGLRAVSQSIRHARLGWVALAAGLELASCAGYVLAFQGTFERLPRRFAALVAASELAFGAVVPLGGAGGIAAGGWLLARRGIPVRRIAERSAVLFLLTSATNVVALLLAAGGLAAGWSPAHTTCSAQRFRRAWRSLSSWSVSRSPGCRPAHPIGAAHRGG
jgi:hypothetical protein